MAARQSGLLDVESLTACWSAIPLEKRDAIEHLDRRLARQAVQQNFLTLWQAQQLLAGRTSGFQVDRYLLLELIGQGGMGRVYLARDTRLNRLVALKILAPERMNNARAVERFKREARVGAQLQHENLVRIYDFGQANGRFFLVMEYIEGKTIGALLTAQGPMPIATAARLAWQITLGLEHAHRKGLIHRDVNPYNILVTHDGIAKLADLGLAIDLADDERVTREGATVGTFDYVAPEQARHSHSADIRSDIYSLGCTLYHMVTGQVPFPSPSLPEKLFAHQALEPTPLDQLVPDMPPEFMGVVQTMMRKQPQDRYATPLHVAQALEPFLDNPIRARNGEPDPEPLPLLPDEAAELPAVLQQAVEGIPAQPGAPVVHIPSHLAAGSGNLAASARMGRDPVSVAPSSERAAGGPAVAAPPILTPHGEPEPGSAEDVPLILDLGPEPSLTDSLSRHRSWFGLEKPLSQSGTIWPGGTDHQATGLLRNVLARLTGSWYWRVAALVGVLALLAAGFALARWLGGNRNSGRAADQNATTALKQATAPRSDRESARPAEHGGTKVEHAITVLVGEREETPAKDLYEALEKALGSDGSVILHNREPLVMPAKSPAISLSGSGYVKVRAAPGVNPVLAVELNGKNPFLAVSPSIHLTLEGLTFRVNYREPAAAGSSEAAACPVLLLAGGPAQLRHCAFEVANQAEVNESCAVVTEGGNLTVEYCWFKGYHTALEIHTIGGATTVIRQTMIVPGAAGRGQDWLPAAPLPDGLSPATADWALRLQYMSGRSSGLLRKLVLDHCTIAGSGLIQLAGFTPQTPLQIEATGCAVRTSMLIGCDAPASERWLQALQWSGKGNRLDVAPARWWLALGKPAPGAATAAVDRDAWLRQAREEEPSSGKITFWGAVDAHPEGLEPGDYAIESVQPGHVGARADQVGPGNRPRTRGAG